MMLQVLSKYYRIEIVRHGDNAVEIGATDRHGNLYSCHISRHTVEIGYWFGCSDFGGSDRLLFRGIIDEFFEELLTNVRDNDRGWYAYHSYRRGSGLTLNWEEARSFAKSKWGIDEDLPDFKGSINYYTIHR